MVEQSGLNSHVCQTDRYMCGEIDQMDHWSDGIPMSQCPTKYVKPQSDNETDLCGEVGRPSEDSDGVLKNILK